MKVVTAREMACRAEMQGIVTEERALRSEIARLASGRAAEPSGGDPRVAERWRLWARKRLETLQGRLAAVLARKVAAEAALGRAMAKRQAVERLCEVAARNRRKRQEANLHDRVLAAELLAGQGRQRHSS